MNGRLSLRARTALTFGLLATVLTAAVLGFVNVMSIRGVGTGLSGRDVGISADTTESASGGPSTGPLPDEQFQVVRLVADQQWLWSLVGIVVAGAIAGAVGWFVSRRMLRPIDEITATATRISASTLHERIGLDGPDDELRRLARAVDELFGRLETAFESQRRFVAQASHELRTPLAVQRASLQIGLRDDATPDEIAGVRTQLLDANRRTEHLIESLLVLAEADRGLDGRVGPCRLDAIATEVVTVLAEPARSAGVTIRTGPWPGLQAVDGDAVLIRQMLLNLVDNAIEYNVAGGEVRVSGDARRITVENTGPVVAAAAAAALVEPFRRTGDACRSADRRHSGLGLSIVDAVARAHGWTLTIRSRPGGGLVVTTALDGVSSMSPRAARSRNTPIAGMGS